MEVSRQYSQPLAIMLALWRALRRAISPKLRPRSLATSPFPPIPRASCTSTRRYHAHETVASGEDDDISDLSPEFFGAYSVILPPEPFVFGVSHIAQRSVPTHIPRPPYMTSSTRDQSTLSGASDDGRIRLSSSGEQRLRQAARLAREVLEYAGTLVKVKADIVVRQQH